jgi:cytochrome c-type biogenesis protein CcmE
MPKNYRILIGSLIVVGALAYFGFSGFQEGKSYYKTIAELNDMGDHAVGKRLRVAGIVAAGSISREGSALTFRLEQDDLTLAVRYTGKAPVPDTFKDGAEALCDGEWRSDGTFVAHSIQAKCASKYESKYGTQEASS